MPDPHIHNVRQHVYESHLDVSFTVRPGAYSQDDAPRTISPHNGGNEKESDVLSGLNISPILVFAF